METEPISAEVNQESNSRKSGHTLPDVSSCWGEDQEHSLGQNTIEMSLRHPVVMLSTE